MSNVFAGGITLLILILGALEYCKFKWFLLPALPLLGEVAFLCHNFPIFPSPMHIWGFCYGTYRTLYLMKTSTFANTACFIVRPSKAFGQVVASPVCCIFKQRQLQVQ